VDITVPIPKMYEGGSHELDSSTQILGSIRMPVTAEITGKTTTRTRRNEVTFT